MHLIFAPFTADPEVRRVKKGIEGYKVYAPKGQKALAQGFNPGCSPRKNAP